jgi:hypothetical protein
MNFMQKALQAFKESNKGNLPEQIFMYRDGLGGPTLYEKAEAYEV